MTLIAIGTKVIANDGFATKAGEVVGHGENRWGQFHIVAINGTTENVLAIGDESMRGIGWKVATDAEFDRAVRCADHTNGTYDKAEDGEYSNWLVSSNID